MKHWFSPKQTTLALILASALALGVTLTGCQSKDAKGMAIDMNEKVLTINGQTVTREKYEPVYQLFAKMFNLDSNPEAMENPMIKEQIKRMTISKLILNELIQMEADKNKIAVSDDEVEKFRLQTVQDSGGQEAFDMALKRSQMTLDDFKTNLKEQLLVTKILEHQKGANLSVSDSEAHTFYQKHPDMFSMPEQIKAEHILIKAMDRELREEIEQEKPSISEADLAKEKAAKKKQRLEKAEDLYKQILADPAKLGALAKRFSDDPGSAQKNGELGFLEPATTEPAFWSALQKTTPGQLCKGVVETPFGFHIIRVLEKKPAHKATFAEVKNNIVGIISNEKKQKALDTWIREKQKSIKITIEPNYQPAAPKTPKGPGDAPPAQAASDKKPEAAASHGG